MAKVVVVYHSGYGHTQQVAQHVAEGAGAQLLAIDAEGNLPAGAWDLLNSADAIIFGSPTYMGSPSWQFKKFADASSKVWFTRGWQDKVFGGFTNSASLNGDKQVSLIYLQTLASQHGGLWVSLGLLPSNAKNASREDINNLGGSVGLLVQSPSDASVDEIPQGDLDTAKAYGQRVAGIAAKLRG
ncbi:MULTISPECIES: flavodoxin family protein [Chromobacterium]|uniref:Flavoprotein WrbA n=3 Tax=Chromobacterium TaxID=535 RepID=A0A1W0CAM0_9NEIS|nr:MULTISPECIES: flavodoxin family protein [Chromobacterium]AXT45508.1 flavodoxin family protein [Chromobacterium rhizoryzae]MBK0414493.1 flavodoxin family protein [Chromobacterium haemolyticum]MBO0415873.1 flavodoxin family protein [Chromobacterium haemolyticum]MBO0499133.1 flavodoxin family protein [Chromobacterium haemolyticum]MDH0342800.1 flavodoxin family protein [Chromobacterium haemolyticum]